MSEPSGPIPTESVSPGEVAEQEILSDPTAVTDEQVQLAWQRIIDATTQLIERNQTETLWEPLPRSSIAADDAKSAPYQCSHAFNMALSSAVDHLHALTSLIFGAGVLHTYAPFTLARGAIENTAVAFWLLHPSSRTERIERTMRWHAANIHDSDHGATTAGATQPRPRDERLASLRRVAESAGCRIDVALNPYRTTTVVRYASKHGLSAQPLGPLFAWQMCSGFTHGRPWSSLGILEREESERDADGNIDLRQSNSLDRALYPALTAFNLLRQTNTLFEERARPHV